MKGLLSRRPSPALVIAILGLVVAMAGTGYAALKLPKNSVGTKQLKANSVTTAKLKKNAVTSAKVKKKTLTGADINLEKLGTVPSANVANTANTLAPPEPTRMVGAPGQPPFQGGSSNFPPSSGLNIQPVGFYKDNQGIVHLEGIAKAGKENILSGISPIFTLPPGYRPTTGVAQIFGGGGNAALIFGSNVNIEGKVLDGVVAGEEEEAVVLSGITFRAAG